VSISPSPCFLSVGSRSCDSDRSSGQTGTGWSGASNPLKIQRSRNPIRPNRYRLIGGRRVSSSWPAWIQIRFKLFKITANLQKSYLSNHRSKNYKLYVSRKPGMCRIH
jgi:hypothetical protein